MSKINVMLDLETLGTAPGCKVISIGAVVFTAAGVSDTERFSAVISRHLQPPLLVEDPETVAWWGRQSAEAQARLFGPSAPVAPMAKVLADFATWIPSGALVWGNGADFDQPLLSAAYRACGMRQPWGNWNGRCYRTLKGLSPAIRMQRQGVHHDALDDAISQARHAVAILNSKGGWE